VRVCLAPIDAAFAKLLRRLVTMMVVLVLAEAHSRKHHCGHKSVALMHGRVCNKTAVDGAETVSHVNCIATRQNSK